MKNRFRPYNKSLLVNVFISTNDYKLVWNEYYIPEYERINFKGAGDWTPLMKVCCNSHTASIIRLFLSHPDIDVNAKNTYGGFVFSYACACGDLKMVQLLLRHPGIYVEREGIEFLLNYVKSNMNNRQELINLLEQCCEK